MLIGQYQGCTDINSGQKADNYIHVVFNITAMM